MCFSIPESHDLKSEAREKLARLSGILATHPDLQLNVEGHTDNTGGVQINQTLSEQRAQAVAKYLVDQGVSRKESQIDRARRTHSRWRTIPPLQDVIKNRRVEIIVSGEAIGSTIGK
jgi:outer membrane protein OmpA-like peptidoglycan-associated protein